MNNKIIFFFFLLLMIGCKINKQNDTPVDLTFLEIHIPDTEMVKKFSINHVLLAICMELQVLQY